MTATRIAPSTSAPPPTTATNRVSTSGVLGPAIASGVAVVLASLALGPLFDSGSWFGATLLTVLVVVVVGGVATWARLPLFLVPIAQVVALFSILVARFTSDAPLGFVPTIDAMTELRAVLSTGMGEVDRFAPPVPYSPGVSAVTAIGIGCVAIVVFVLQVNLRMPVVAGLALMAVYVVPALVLADGAPWWSFAAVAVAWMVLLISDERVGLASWGRVLRRSGRGGDYSAMSGLSSAALRLGAVAILAAIALPILVPSLADDVLGRHGTGVGDGPGTGVDPGQSGLDPFVSLKRDLLKLSDTTMFRYTTDNPDPGYLRVVVLTQYSGERWSAPTFVPTSQNRITDDLTLPVDFGNDTGGVSSLYSFTSTAFKDSHVPVPAHATRIKSLPGDWYVDETTGTIFSLDSDTGNATWQVQALDAKPTPTQLQASPSLSGADTESVRNASTLPPDVAALAAQVSAQGSTPYEQAVLLEQYFRKSFRYSTAAGTDQSSSALESFLRDKSGYCQQFAAAMALMAQSLGIPARVVVGYTQGTKEGPTSWVVQGKDAHAWPELFFKNVGWVPFEPTPRTAADGGGTVQVPDYSIALPTPTSPGGRTPVPSASAVSGSKLRGRLLEDSPGATSVDGPAADAAPDAWRVRLLLALLVVGVVLAAVPAVVRWLRRRRRLSATASAEDAWEELHDTARDLGIDWSDARTPRQAVARVIEREHLTGTDADAATRVGRLIERSRYAPVPPTTEGLADDVSTVRTALLTRVDRSTRVRAALLPPSLRRG